MNKRRYFLSQLPKNMTKRPKSQTRDVENMTYHQNVSKYVSNKKP